MPEPTHDDHTHRERGHTRSPPRLPHGECWRRFMARHRTALAVHPHELPPRPAASQSCQHSTADVRGPIKLQSEAMQDDDITCITQALGTARESSQHAGTSMSLLVDVNQEAHIKVACPKTRCIAIKSTFNSPRSAARRSPADVRCGTYGSKTQRRGRHTRPSLLHVSLTRKSARKICSPGAEIRLPMLQWQRGSGKICCQQWASSKPPGAFHGSQAAAKSMKSAR